MKNKKLLKNLINLGLSENEAQVYLASLSLGSATITKIAQAAEIKRTTVYSVIESLKVKGLINTELRGWKKKYVAENPEKLKSILDEKRNKLIQDLPEYMSLYNLKGSEGVIKYYEGIEATKTIYENILKELKSGDDYLIISDLKRFLALDEKYFSDFLKKRAKYNFNIRLLHQDSEIAREYQKNEKIYNQKIKILPKETKLSTNLVILPYKIIIHQLTPPVVAMVIENKSIIQMHREFFEIMWRSIK